jgi:phospholipid/cholesterol/gamma-HCH transport system permease protein
MNDHGVDDTNASIDVLRVDDVITLAFAGDWADADSSIELGGSVIGNLRQDVRGLFRGDESTVRFDCVQLGAWDTRLLVAVAGVIKVAEERGVITDLSGLPSGAEALIRLSRSVPPRAEPRSELPKRDFLASLGGGALETMRMLGEANQFLGESLLALWRFVRGKARFMKSDVLEFIQSTGPHALPIVGIINVLLGVILGFMGAVQLRQFGAEIYVANLVALGQTREIAPMMTAIVMAGRTGAAYAAQLGTMQVNEEIDALKTFGFSPMDFLVLPRMLALAIMFPILVLYADALGMFGGYLVGVGVLGLGTTEYIEQTRNAIDMGDILLGVVKGSVFGILVAVTGCLQGMQSGRSASAVGDATTKAVVTGIIAIIVMTAVFAVLSNVLGI